MRETDFDVVRWLIYGGVLIALASASFIWPIALWAFGIILIVAVGDIVYTRYFKGRIWA